MGTPAEGTNRISRSRRLRPGSFSSEETLPCSKSPADREGDHAHPPAGQSAELSAACEPAALLERLIEIFLSANEGPVASGRGAAAIKATLAYILAMDIAVRDLWALRRTQVSDRTSCPERTAQVGASILKSTTGHDRTLSTVRYTKCSSSMCVRLHQICMSGRSCMHAGPYQC